MPRYLLALLLLAGAVSAQAMTPVHQGANGAGGTCPENEVATAEAADGNEDARPAATKTAPPSQAKGGTLARPAKAGARWHSFLPGMFK